MQSILQSLNADSATQCPVCNKHLKTTQGLSAHLRSAKKCSWYRLGKLSELKIPELQIGDDTTASQEEELQVSIHRGSAHCEQDPSDVVENFVGRAFDFIPLEDSLPDRGLDLGPSHQGRLNPQDGSDGFVDEHVEEDPFPSAGRAIRMDPTLHEKWRAMYGHEDADGDTAMGEAALPEQEFAPFASELDWRVARWVVQEGIPQALSGC